MVFEFVEVGILEKYGVFFFGILFEIIKKVEDREFFKKIMIEIGEFVLKSIIVYFV